MIAVQNIDAMEAAQLREAVRAMRAEVKHKDAVIRSSPMRTQSSSG